MKLNIQSAIWTNIGGRNVNEDSVKAVQKGNQYGFMLCDGLGGHGMGDAASQLVVSVFESCFNDASDLSKFLGPTFEAAQSILMQEQKNRHAEDKMKTTGVALAIDEKKAYIGHVGDSRCYIFHKNKYVKRTLDHSIPQMLVIAHDIKESEIRHHPERNIVLKVLGIEWEDKMYELMKPVNIKKCQAFLLCSDGFWELIEEADMCATLQSASSPEEWLQMMAEIVHKNGAGTNMDNNSAIAVWTGCK